MIFKTLPKNGASWLSPLLYSLEFEEREEQVEVEIYDLLSSVQLGRIRLYNISSAEVDIAPYIRSCKLNQPLAPQSDIIGPSADACRVVLRVKGEVSEPRLLFRGDISGRSTQVLSTIVENGSVAVGEVIRFTLLARQSINLVLTRPSEGGIETYSCRTDGVPCEVAVPINVAEEGENILIRVTCDDEYLGVFRYRVVARDKSAVTLVWVNTAGGVECCTFNQSVKRTLSVKSEDVECECGWYRRVLSATVVRRLIMGGALQEEMNRVLGLLLSPRVFRCDGWESVAVQLLTETIKYDEHGRLSRLEFDINEEWKGGIYDCA